MTPDTLDTLDALLSAAQRATERVREILAAEGTAQQAVNAGLVEQEIEALRADVMGMDGVRA
jgi:hypothetical protein